MSGVPLIIYLRMDRCLFVLFCIVMLISVIYQNAPSVSALATASSFRGSWVPIRVSGPYSCYTSFSSLALTLPQTETGHFSGSWC